MERGRGGQRGGEEKSDGGNCGGRAREGSKD